MPTAMRNSVSAQPSVNATQKWIDAWLRHNHNTARTEAAIGQAVASLHFAWDSSRAERSTKAWIRECVSELKRQLGTVYVVSRRNAATFLRSLAPLKIRESTEPDPNLIPNPNPLEAAALVDKLWQKGSWAWSNSLIANDAALARFTTQQVSKAKGIITQGVADGLTPAELASQLEDQMQTPHNWTRVARTEVQRVNNQALQDSYALNQDLMAGQQFVATLDTNTCPVCGAYDGRSYYYKPVAGQAPISTLPQAPLHPNCRCVLSPILKAAEDLATEIGVPLDLLPPELDGQPTPRQSYTDWLKTQPEATQKKALTPQQFELFNQGVTIDQMTTGGKTMEPEELAKVKPGEIADVATAEKLKSDQKSEEIAKNAPGTVDTANSPTPIATKAGVEKITPKEPAQPVVRKPETPTSAPTVVPPSPPLVQYVEIGSTSKGYPFRKKPDGSYEVRFNGAWHPTNLNHKGQLSLPTGQIAGKPSYVVGAPAPATTAPTPKPKKVVTPPTPATAPPKVTANPYVPSPPTSPPTFSPKPGTSVGWGGPGAGNLPSGSIAECGQWWKNASKDKSVERGIAHYTGEGYRVYRKFDRCGGLDLVQKFKAAKTAETKWDVLHKSGFVGEDWKSARARGVDSNATFGSCNFYMPTYEPFRKAMAKAPRWHGEVFRGMNFDSGSDFKKFISEYEPGNEVTMNSVNSWSRTKQVAVDFSKGGSSGSVVFQIKNSRLGTSIEEVSEIPSEREVLTPAGMKCRVVSKQVGKDGRTYVELEELREASKLAEGRRYYVAKPRVPEATGDRWTDVSDWEINGHFPLQEGHTTGDKARLVRRYRAVDNAWARHTARFWEENPAQIAERLRNWEREPIPCVRVRGPGAPAEWPIRWVQIITTKDGFAEVVSLQKRPGAFSVKVHPRYANDGMDDAMRKFLLPFAPRCKLHGPKTPQWKRGNLVCFVCPCGQQKEFL